MIQGFDISKKGVGTVIGRRSVSKGKEYVRVWIYIPTKVSEDTAFPFKIGDPCEVEIDTSRRQLVVTPISVEKAQELGWAKRQRHR